MKWIHISKAKPVFDQQYLIFSENLVKPVIGYLEQTVKTANGLHHQFTIDGGTVEAEHIAAINLPSAKED